MLGMTDPAHIDHVLAESSRHQSMHDVLGQRNIPWKAVALAFSLLAMGVFAMIAGLVIWAGDTNGSKHGMALFLLGVIVFIPGSYHSTIAYKAFMGRPGFSFSTLPDV
mmetsp:Transcript_10078/g.13734  ORF Transcript_10078/g.13734 Transcript_10078/m.13734 type:complete len:108 (+) Transcript_10078:84-407(+)